MPRIILGVLLLAGVQLASSICCDHVCVAESLKIGAFNAEILGATKASNASVLDVLAQIIRRYDVIFVQGIRDVGGKTVVPKLLAQVNGEAHQYEVVVSGNLGRTRNRETYAYFYRTETVEVCGTYQFDDPDDEFEREPFSICICCNQTNEPETATEPWKFFLLGVHVKPSDACSELGALANAYRATSEALDCCSGFILGDLKADCTHLSGCAFEDLEIVNYPSASWLIDFSVDTTTTPTYCAYDRIIAVDDIRHHVVQNSAGVYRFDEDLSLSPELVEDVSDHYPVEVTINKNARCLKTIILIVVLSTHSEAHSKGPHNLTITVDNENRTFTLEEKVKDKYLPNQQEFDLKDLGFTECCLQPTDIQNIFIVPGSTDAWSFTSVVTLAKDCLGDCTLITCDINIDFAVDQDNRGGGKTLELTLAKN